MRLTSTLAVGVMLGGLALGTSPASAAPAMPQKGAVAGTAVEHVMHRHHHHHYGHGHTTKAERMLRRRNTMRHGNPNARNPERPGYQQQLGNTTNGPRY